MSEPSFSCETSYFCFLLGLHQAIMLISVRSFPDMDGLS